MNGTPLFLGNDYEIWKVIIRVDIMEIEIVAWGCVINGYIPPNKVKTKVQKDARKNNSMEMEAILNGLEDSIK